MAQLRTAALVYQAMRTFTDRCLVNSQGANDRGASGVPARSSEVTGAHRARPSL